MEIVIQRSHSELESLNAIINDLKQKSEYQNKTLQQCKEELNKICDLKRDIQTVQQKSIYFSLLILFLYI